MSKKKKNKKEAISTQVFKAIERTSDKPQLCREGYTKPMGKNIRFGF